jgi:hypothetical protein
VDKHRWGREGGKVLKGEAAKRFAGSHLRSARITHLAETTQNLPGVHCLVGHKLISTTARYVTLAAGGPSSIRSGATPEERSKKKNRLIMDQAVFSVQRRGLEPPSQLRRQHLKLVCLPVPPPLRGVVDRKGAGVYLKGRGGRKGQPS